MAKERKQNKRVRTHPQQREYSTGFYFNIKFYVQWLAVYAKKANSNSARYGERRKDVSDRIVLNEFAHHVFFFLSLNLNFVNWSRFGSHICN